MSARSAACTPTPWTWTLKAENLLTIDADNCTVATIASWSYGEPNAEAAQANTRFIVEACNAYDSLRAENERLRKALDNALMLMARAGTYLSHPDVAAIPFALKAGNTAEAIARFISSMTDPKICVTHGNKALVADIEGCEACEQFAKDYEARAELKGKDGGE